MRPRSNVSFLSPPAAVAACLGWVLLHAAATASANQITYQIDMSVQIASGNFTPGADGVSVAGNFNGWAMVSLANVAGTTLYQTTITNPLAAGEWENHKFIIVHQGGADEWESIADRFFQVTAEDQVLPIVYFNDATALPEVTQVTWSVDMRFQTDKGTFDPRWDYVNVAGDMNNWEFDQGELWFSVDDDNVWTGTFDVTNYVGTVMNYKFLILKSTGEVWERDGLGPGGARNRQFTFTNEVTTLPVVYFNNEEVSAVVTQEVQVTVSLEAQIARGDIEPPSAVWVAGDMTDWIEVALTQDPANAATWSGLLEVVGTPGGVAGYKFLYEESPGVPVWEDDGVGGNPGPRQLPITEEATTLPKAYFNDDDNVGVLTIRSAASGQVNLEWTGGPRIRLQADASLSGGYDDVSDTEGNSSATVDVESGEAYFRVTGP